MSLNKSVLDEVVKQLASAAGTRVRALDVFFYYKEEGEEQENRAVSHSIGEPAYVDESGYLDQFVKEYGTLARTNKPRRICGKIESRINPPARFPRLKVNEHKFVWPDEQLKIAEPQQLVSFLGEKSFGRFYFLATVYHHIRQIDVHLSAFVVFAEPVAPEKEATTWIELLWLLLTKLENPITEELSAKRAHYRNEWRLSTLRNRRVRHIMKNVPFKFTLGLLGDAIFEKDCDGAKALMKALEVQDLVRDYAIDILYQAEVGPENLLLAQSAISSYTRLLELLTGSCEEPNRLMITGASLVSDCQSNVIALKDIVPALVLLINVWQNAWKNHRAANRNGKVEVVCERSGEAMALCISNDGIMDRQFIERLNGTVIEPNGDSQGITDIIEAKDELKGVKVFAKSEDGRTTIKIEIGP